MVLVYWLKPPPAWLLLAQAERTDGLLVAAMRLFLRGPLDFELKSPPAWLLLAQTERTDGQLLAAVRLFLAVPSGSGLEVVAAGYPPVLGP